MEENRGEVWRGLETRLLGSGVMHQYGLSLVVSEEMVEVCWAAEQL